MFDDVYSFFFPPEKVEPTETLVDYLSLQNPPTPRYTFTQIEENKLTCIGYHPDTERAEYVDAKTVFEHVLTTGKTGVGKSSYYRSSFLARWITFYQQSSVVIFDAMDGVIEDAITLCEKAHPSRPYIVLPDAGMNVLNCSNDPHEIASRFAQAYMQQADKGGAFFNHVAKSWILAVIPLLMATYPTVKPTLLDLRSLASDKMVRQWLVEDAERRSAALPELFTYREQFGGTGKAAADELSYNLRGLGTYLLEITSGKFAWMLNQRDAPSLETFINDPRHPVIIMRVGDYEGSVKHTLGILGISMVSAFIMNRDIATSGHPCLFYIDEGGLMTQTASDTTPKNLASILQTARKRRCGFIIGLQTLEQVPKEFRETFVNGCRTIIIQPDCPPADAKYFADMIGNARYRVTYPSESIDPDGKKRIQVSSQDKIDYIMSPDAIRNIRRDEVIVLTPYHGAKRTPLYLKKPFWEFEATPYTEPQAPNEPPQTLWQEMGYYQTRLTATGKPAPQPTKEQQETFLAEAEQAIQAIQGVRKKHK
ncbi:MAG: TraM recognition domain-containing protein [Ktedonobacteraceae bacterium]